MKALLFKSSLQGECCFMFSVKTELFSFVTSDAFSTLCQTSSLPQKADTLLRVKWMPDLQLLTALCQGEAK